MLPLSGVTHMASQDVVAENLMLLQVQFLRDASGATPRSGITRMDYTLIYQREEVSASRSP